jgi:hypothetical protein
MTREDKIKALEDHDKKWTSEYQRLRDEKLEQFSKEPIDKKTAIVCTAFIVGAIKELSDCLVKSTKAIRPGAEMDDCRPLDSKVPEMYEDPPGCIVGAMVTEILSPTSKEGDYWEAHRHAFNAANWADHTQMKDERLDWLLSQINQTPEERQEILNKLGIDK